MEPIAIHVKWSLKNELGHKHGVMAVLVAPNSRIEWKYIKGDRLPARCFWRLLKHVFKSSDWERFERKHRARRFPWRTCYESSGANEVCHTLYELVDKKWGVQRIAGIVVTDPRGNICRDGYLDEGNVTPLLAWLRHYYGDEPGEFICRTVSECSECGFNKPGAPSGFEIQEN